MKRFFLFACATILVATAITSCKKSSSTPTVQTEIIGNWTVTKVYVDTNNNKTMDANELTTSSLYSGSMLKFNSDHSFSTVLLGVTLTGTWQLTNNDTYVQVITTGPYGDSTSFHIESINSSTAEVKDTTDQANGGTTWLYMSK